jgi:hypothetical protein
MLLEMEWSCAYILIASLAPNRLPVDCESGGAARIRLAQCAYFGHSARVASWIARGCWDLGVLGGYHWEETRFQYESVLLRGVCVDSGCNAGLYLVFCNVSVRGPIYRSQLMKPRVAIYSAGAGGNYILDATNFLEFLPSTHAWLVTFMAVWWAVGYTVTGLLAWAFMSNYSCPPDATTKTCTRADNMGWRYLHFTCGALVLALAGARLVFIKMVQTPRWLISQNRDEEVIKNLNDISTKYKKSHSLTLEQLQAEGRVLHTEKSVWSAFRIKEHFRGLFRTRKLGWSTTVIIANWFVIGMVSPLYSVFLPFYLASRGADVGDNSNYTTWRDYAINQVAGLAGPIIAAVLVETNFIGRRGTLAIGAAITMVLQFGYTQITTPAQNLGVSAAISAAS